MPDPPILCIDLASAVPAYAQIAAQIRALLVSGDLPPGRRLPPVRQLALDLGVHHNTVALAYRALAEEGWLDLRRGRGAVVLERRERRASAQAKTDFSRRLGELVGKAAADGLSPQAVAQEFEALACKLWKGRKS